MFVLEDGSVFEGAFKADRPDLATGRFSYGAAGAAGSGGGVSAATGAAAAEAAEASCQSAGVEFGPRVGVLQFYIGDLLGEEAAPEAAKAVTNLMIGFNPDLRLLYDKYW